MRPVSHRTTAARPPSWRRAVRSYRHLSSGTAAQPHAPHRRSWPVGAPGRIGPHQTAPGHTEPHCTPSAPAAPDLCPLSAEGPTPSSPVQPCPSVSAARTALFSLLCPLTSSHYPLPAAPATRGGDLLPACIAAPPPRPGRRGPAKTCQRQHTLCPPGTAPPGAAPPPSRMPRIAAHSQSDRRAALGRTKQHQTAPGHIEPHCTPPAPSRTSFAPALGRRPATQPHAPHRRSQPVGPPGRTGSHQTAPDSTGPHRATLHPACPQPHQLCARSRPKAPPRAAPFRPASLPAVRADPVTPAATVHHNPTTAQLPPAVCPAGQVDCRGLHISKMALCGPRTVDPTFQRHRFGCTGRSPNSAAPHRGPPQIALLLAHPHRRPPPLSAPAALHRAAAVKPSTFPLNLSTAIAPAVGLLCVHCAACAATVQQSNSTAGPVAAARPAQQVQPPQPHHSPTTTRPYHRRRAPLICAAQVPSAAPPGQRAGQIPRPLPAVLLPRSSTPRPPGQLPAAPTCSCGAAGSG